MNNYDGDLLLLRKRISQIERLCGAISEAIGINLDELVRRADQAPASSPALTRADILRWPESEDGLRRLREECLFIVYPGARVNRDAYRSLGSWQPDRDVNQCKIVVDAMMADGWQWGARVIDARAYADFWHRDRGEVEIGFEELPTADWLMKTCIAACIAMLRPSQRPQSKF